MKISDLNVDWSAKRAHEIIIRQFPQYADAEKPLILGRGWDNVCVIYHDSIVFRLPTRQLGGEIMAIEREVLPKIAPNLSLPVPDFQYFGEPDGDYLWPFVGYPLLFGETSEKFRWTNEQRMQAALVMGRFLGGLHQIPITQELAEVLPPDLIDRATKSAILRRIDNYLLQIEKSYPERVQWAGRYRELAISLSEGFELDPKLCIVHGDLYPRHILTNNERELVGVIDWGDVHLGHPFLDLSIAYTFFTSQERESFWAAYGLPVEVATKVFGQLKAINYILALFLYGKHTANDTTLAMVDQIEYCLQT